MEKEKKFVFFQWNIMTKKNQMEMLQKNIF